MKGRGRKGRGNGSWRILEPPSWFRATTVQLCGLWPFAGGTSVPQYGAPVGKHIDTGVAVACDPISYFTTGLISNPSMLLMGKPGLGKSTLAARMIFALEAMGIHTLVLGDLKPDYVEVINAVGGQIIRLGRGRGHLNVLDHQYAVDAAQEQELVSVTSEDGQSWWFEYEYVLDEGTRREILGDAHGRRKNGVESLLNVVRKAPPSEMESSILDTALDLLFQGWNGPGCPLLIDLVAVIEEAPQALRDVALDHGKIRAYHKTTDPLVASLRSLATGGGLGAIFSQRTDVVMRMDRSVVFDVSSIDQTETELQAAALLACWNYGFGQVELRQQLADLGKIQRQNYLVVMDELWRALRVGRGMVDRVDAATRLNRTQGIGLLFITHTLKDMDAVQDQAERVKAQGIAERCGIIGMFGLPRSEILPLQGVVHLTRREQSMITGWAQNSSWDQNLNKKGDPPGLGLCLIKVAGGRGLPVKVVLTKPELDLHNTNQRWARLAHDQRSKTAA